jgi:hypothetical protein
VGLLSGDMTAIFGAAFGVLYLDGTLHRQTRTEADNGDVTVAWADAPMKYQPDRITEAMRQANGFTDKDAAFLILQAGQAPINDDCEFTAKASPIEAARRWAVKSNDSDPGGTHWIVRASPA